MDQTVGDEGADTSIPESSERPARSLAPYRRMAEDLVWAHIDDPDTFPQMLRTVDIARIVQEEFELTYNQAKSAATKAVNKLDPGNPARRSRKVPVGRRMPDAKRHAIQSMWRQEYSSREIAEAIGVDRRTVNANIKRMRERGEL